MPIEPAPVRPHPRPALRHRRIGSRNAGFITLGIALAVLAGGSLFAGASGALNASATASAPTPSDAVAAGTPPVDHARAGDAGNVVISEAPAASPSETPKAVRLLQ